MFRTKISPNIVLSVTEDQFAFSIDGEVEIVATLDTEEYLCIEAVLAAIAWPPIGGYSWRCRRDRPMPINVEYLAASSLGSNWTAYVRADADIKTTIWLDIILLADWRVVRVRLDQREARAGIENVLRYVRDLG